MSFFRESDSPLAFAAFVKALAWDNGGRGIAVAVLRDALVRELWRDSFYACDGDLGPDCHPHAVVAHPLLGGEVAPQPQPVTRHDIVHGLTWCDGLPAAARSLARRMDGDPDAARALFLSLTAVAWADYPAPGRTLIGRLILPLRHLREVCRRHDFLEPEVLRRRLTEHGVDAAVAVAERRPGRPRKYADRYLAKFEERVRTGKVVGSAMGEARWLRAWLRQTLAQEGLPTGENDLPKEETIRNVLGRRFDFQRRRRREVS